MQLDTPNRNGRVYQSDKMNKDIQEYLKNNEFRLGRINGGENCLGDIDHPVTLNEASHKIDKLTVEGNELIGDISILDTPQGKNVQALLDSNIKLAFAPRMAVDIQEEKDEEGNVILDENGQPKTYIADIKLESIDIIQDCNKTFDNANIEIVNE
jgi:hypothetical protein